MVLYIAFYTTCKNAEGCVFNLIHNILDMVHGNYFQNASYLFINADFVCFALHFTLPVKITKAEGRVFLIHNILGRGYICKELLIYQ